MKNFPAFLPVFVIGLLLLSSCSKESNEVQPISSAQSSDATDDGQENYVFTGNGNGIQKLGTSYEWGIGNNLTGLDPAIYGSTTTMTVTRVIITKSGNRAVTWKGQVSPAPEVDPLTGYYTHTDSWTDYAYTPAMYWTTTCTTNAAGNVVLTLNYKAK